MSAPTFSRFGKRDGLRPLSNSTVQAYSEVEPDDKQRETSRTAYRQSRHSGKIGGRPALLSSGMQRSQRDVCGAEFKDDKVRNVAGATSPQLSIISGATMTRRILDLAQGFLFIFLAAGCVLFAFQMQEWFGS